MKRLLRLILIVMLLAVPVSALEITAPEVPESGKKWMPGETSTFGEGLLELFTPERKEQRKTKANFKNEQRRIHHEMKTKPYTRKCEVCGRTDADYPDLEFRFCSRCEGYHCYCLDHISNHVHKTN